MQEGGVNGLQKINEMLLTTVFIIRIIILFTYIFQPKNILFTHTDIFTNIQCNDLNK
jgi:hypothetical protein